MIERSTVFSCLKSYPVNLPSQYNLKQLMATTHKEVKFVLNQEAKDFTVGGFERVSKNTQGFRPIIFSNIVENKSWMAPQLSFYLPALQGTKSLNSNSEIPFLSTQETPSVLNYHWCFNPHPSLCSPLNVLPQSKEEVSAKEIPFSVIKHEEKMSNGETGHQSQLNIPDEQNQKGQDYQGIRKQKRKQIDKDYVPNRSQKKQPRKRLHENQNRNVIPNQINQIISFLQKRNKSEQILAKLWQKMPPKDETFSITRFYLYQNMMKDQNGHYSNQKQLSMLGDVYEPECRVWDLDEQRHYITLSRMLVGHFLREDSIPIILTSKRMKKDKKAEHLRARREVARRVLELMGGAQ